MSALTEFLSIANDSFFGEDIYYTHDSEEVSRRAVVQRNVLSNIPKRFDRGNESKILKNLVYIRIAKDSVYGVPEITPREDTVRIKKYEGGSTYISGTVTDIIHQDETTWKVSVSL